MNRLSLLILTGVLLAMPALAEDACKTKPAAAKTDKGESPFVCDRLALTPEIRKRHFDELGPALVAVRTDVRELKDGYEFQFPGDPKTLAMVTEWVAQEHLCCPFFDIDVRIEREAGSVWMRVTGRPGTKEFIQADGAEWIRK